MASSSSVAEVIPTRADERDSVPDDSCIGIQYHNNSYGVSTEEAEEASSLANIAIDEDEEENNNKDNASAADQKTKAMKEKKPHQKHHKYQKQPKQPKQQKALSSSSASQSASSSSSSSTLADPSSSSSSSSPLDSTPTFTMTSLGCISSVYKLKYGTPRQGTIAPASRGSLTLHSSIPLESLEGLSEFSHIWLLFIFHRNTNKQFHSRIAPPRAKGVKYGVFATRTPHRINPVGLSLVKLDRIEKRTLFLSSLDLIQGTPVIDIKPYHPADSVPSTDYSLPDWLIDDASSSPPFTVTFTQSASDELRAILASGVFIEFYQDYDSLYEGICESVSHDPRPNYVRERKDALDEIYGFRFDRFNILFKVDPIKRTAEVCGVQYLDYQKLKKEIMESERNNRLVDEAKEASVHQHASDSSASLSTNSAAAASSSSHPPSSTTASSSSSSSSSSSLAFDDEDALTKHFLESRPR